MKQGLRAEVERVVGDLHIVVENHSDILRNNALPFRILIGLRTIGQFLFIEHSFLFKMTPYPIWMETSGIFKTRPKDRSPWISRGHREEWKRGIPAPVQCWKQTFLLLNRLQNSHNVGLNGPGKILKLGSLEKRGWFCENTGHYPNYRNFEQKFQMSPFFPLTISAFFHF